MANKSAILSVKLVSDAKEFGKGFKTAESGVQKFQKGISKMTLPATGILAGLAAIGKKTFGLASDAEQNFGAVDAVFKDHADAVHRMAQTTAKDIGVSGSDYEKYATLIGSQLKNLGTPMDELGGKTDSLVRMGADFAAQFGGSNVEAIEAISSALKGEMDPIERYGISLNQAAIKAKMAEMGMDGLTGKAGQQGKAMAIMALLNEQGADAMGANAREAGTAAGALARMTAQTADAGAKLGTALLPLVVSASEALAGFATWVSENTGLVQTLALVLAGLAGSVLAINGAFKVYSATMAVARGATVAFKGAMAVGSAFSSFRAGFMSTTAAASTFTGRMGTVGGAVRRMATSVAVGTKALALNSAALVRNAAVATAGAIKTVALATAKGVATAAQWLWNAALLANPLTWIIVAVIALVAAIVWLATQTTFFQDTWAIMSAFVTAAIAAVTAWFISTWQAVSSFFSGLVAGIQAAWGVFTAFIQTAITVAIGVVRTVIETIRSTISSVIETAKGIFQSGWDTMKSIAKGAIDGVIGFIDGIIGSVKSAINWVKDLFSFSPPGWMKDVGGFLGFGGTGGDMVANFGVGSQTIGATGAGFAGAFSSGSSRSVTVNNKIVIEFKGLVTDKVGTAREIRKVLREADLLTGAA